MGHIINIISEHTITLVLGMAFGLVITFNLRDGRFYY